MKLASLLLLVSITAAADPVIYIEKATPAPYAGYLFTPEAELKNRLQLLDGDYYKQLEVLSQKSIETYKLQLSMTESQRDLWSKEAQRLSKELVSNQDSSFWKSSAYFALGCVVTTAIAFAVNKATK